MLYIIFLFILFLVWGSFLNSVGFRLINDYSIVKPRSFCPNCKSIIKPYDLIPVLSWLMLRGKCRACQSPISFLYPAIEIFTAIVFTLLFLFILPKYWLAYGLFFSALIVTIRTDAETMLISSYATLYIIPVGIIFAYFNLLPINLSNSITGAFSGYLSLWIIAKIFFALRKIQGIGEGDFELLAAIGAFTGIIGVWFSLFVGALLGSILGIILLLNGHSNLTKIPFGPWLAVSAIIFVFIQQYLLQIIL